ncbi:tRNA-intron lyase [Sulfolobus acidocaldarius]|uniref:tRNA-splicing endonuclease n=4 Tax=Sulfolobus acidocaldarius TaxID=2285 RepID=ENDA_SULAC|nr:tRNA-intron lyase [Sulfolobus acidocaldarius]Q4JAF4.1 RecName: Full=tRNA-splicing endonuclease; AltName: Full=tRNA-intron endonuclease [Sulfolobus acidocaldarius DSM 639]AAY80225.1 tRNA-intron endonuclease [Sulfolobus acidocaldarius DSM 639]AGE70804.1 tRNA-splicing endonuclease subunit alpha [Sulfolobus acidocaldarius N8]AGE73075.1 tRNA-splicing endonuclease subunit alpha [Sulfolobus acidocaldarius Ron12/I]ALU28878.1 ribonuclease BN [Sulfolobus acidocaldarius]ALU31600.1 ribonuclease BN [Su
MIQGEILGDKVLINDVEKAKEIYKLGYYGKPLDITKPKSPEDIKKPLILSLIEALYLSKKKIIEVIRDGKVIDDALLYKIGMENIPRFELLYTVYEDLREKKFVVRSGMKYGADFAIYTVAPGLEHAPYLVIAIDEEQEISPNEILGFGRVSHSTRKNLILSIVNQRNRSIRYIMFKWLKL